MKASNDFIGRMMTDIQQARGTFDDPILSETDVILTGRAPVATLMSYSTTFAAYTNGKGALTLQFDGYDVCHNTEDVIAQIGYDKNADLEYSSSSIFVQRAKDIRFHGEEAQAYHALPVGWDEPARFGYFRGYFFLGHKYISTLL